MNGRFPVTFEICRFLVYTPDFWMHVEFPSFLDFLSPCANLSLLGFVFLPASSLFATSLRVDLRLGTRPPVLADALSSQWGGLRLFEFFNLG